MLVLSLSNGETYDQLSCKMWSNEDSCDQLRSLLEYAWYWKLCSFNWKHRDGHRYNENMEHSNFKNLGHVHNEYMTIS